MKSVKMERNVKVVGEKNLKGEEKLIDYYIVTEAQERIYAFSKVYTHHTYNLCKSGIRVNDLMTTRSRDTSVMRLVKYTKVIIPYLAEEYNLAVA